ncbi:MAG: cytidine deaminase [Pseudomonadota bacterium]
MTDKTDKALLETAAEVSNRAHAPYSNFRVGAALVDESGTAHTGCNVENGAYPEGICAEAGAISAMAAAGGRRIRTIAVWGADIEPGSVCVPCGGCRQKISEFATDDTRIVLGGPGVEPQVFSIDELLPLRFVLGPRGRR